MIIEFGGKKSTLLNKILPVHQHILVLWVLAYNNPNKYSAPIIASSTFDLRLPK